MRTCPKCGGEVLLDGKAPTPIATPPPETGTGTEPGHDHPDGYSCSICTAELKRLRSAPPPTDAEFRGLLDDFEAAATSETATITDYEDARAAVEKAHRSEVERLTGERDRLAADLASADETLRLTRDGADLLVGAEERAQAAESTVEGLRATGRALLELIDDFQPLTLAGAEHARLRAFRAALSSPAPLAPTSDLVRLAAEAFAGWAVGMDIVGPLHRLRDALPVDAVESALAAERARRDSRPAALDAPAAPETKP